MSKLDFGPTSPLLPRFGANLNPFAPQAPQQVPPPLLPAQPASPAAKDNLQVGSHVNTPGSATASFSMEPEEPSFILHKVKRGDNLSDIAQKYLGNRNLHMEIYNANRDDLMNPNDLRIGMTLKIPVPAAPAQPEKPVNPAP